MSAILNIVHSFSFNEHVWGLYSDLVHLYLVGSVAPPDAWKAFIWTKLFQYSQNVVPTLLSSFQTSFQFAYISFAQPETILNFMRFPSFVISTSLFLCLRGSYMFYHAVIYFFLHLSIVVLTFCQFSITFSIPTFYSLLCPVLLSSTLLFTFSPIYRERLISVWHFVIFPSYLITNILYTLGKRNLVGTLILDVWQPDIVLISPPTGGGCLVDRLRAAGWDCDVGWC